MGAKRRRRGGRALLRRWYRSLSALPRPAQAAIATVAVLVLALALNWVYQVIRKPAELFFPLSGVLSKTPSQTWRQYGPIFRAHATDMIRPELLAALAQVEGSGNPVAQTYWRWQLTVEPSNIYRPASSAVGMYQITDGTFHEARRLCIHDGAVVEEGAWNDWRSCWFNSLYMRVVPSHAAEMTAAYLHRRAADALQRLGISHATPRQKQDLAAVIHLCGASAGFAYAKNRFRARPGQRCGAHDLARYLEKVNEMAQVFARYGAAT
jgi:hypothetical protein